MSKNLVVSSSPESILCNYSLNGIPFFTSDTGLNFLPGRRERREEKRREGGKKDVNDVIDTEPLERLPLFVAQLEIENKT